jgi:pimeloyl-ACP methyl ester carboxylesterase
MKLGDLYVYTGGKPFDAAKPCVVMIHGAQNDHSVWALQSRWLANHGYAVLAVDLPGHGKSGGTALPTVQAMAQALWDALDVAAVARTHLVGHSMGSLIALQMTGDAPERVASLALLGTAYPMPVGPALLGATQTDVPAALDMINAFSFSGAAGGFARRQSSPGSVNLWGSLALMRQIAARNGAAVLHNDFNACNAYAGGADAAIRVTCPVLVMNGEQDAMTVPKSAKALAALLPGSRTVLLPQCGHALMIEQADLVREHLAAHLATAIAA